MSLERWSTWSTTSSTLGWVGLGFDDKNDPIYYQTLPNIDKHYQIYEKEPGANDKFSEPFNSKVFLGNYKTFADLEDDNALCEMLHPPLKLYYNGLKQ